MSAPLPSLSHAAHRREHPPGRVASPAPNGAAEPAQDAAARFSTADWNDLLDAVMGRLRLSVLDPPHAKDALPHASRAQTVAATVLECVAALDQLHAALRLDLGQLEKLKLDVFDLQTALAQARADLAGTQAGERHARHLAAHDALTSLPNRGLFRERLDQALVASRPYRGALAVLYLDLDDFKPVNDSYGHAVGDEVLRIVAKRLKRTLRSDDLVSRLGGDEFACLVAGRLDRGQLTALARKLFDAVSAPLRVGELQLGVTPSIGIAMQPAGHDGPDALLRRADAAMYRAKRERCGVAFFE